MKTASIVSAILVAVVVLTGAITNPSQEAHREHVREFMNNRVNEKMMDKKSGVGTSLFMLIGGNRLIDGMASKVRTKSYVVFSEIQGVHKDSVYHLGYSAFGNMNFDMDAWNNFGKEMTRHW